MITLRNQQEIARITRAAKAVSEVHLAISSAIRPGVSTKYLENIAIKIMTQLGVASAYLGTKGFPKAVYFDTNNAVCHTITADEILKDGDIVKIGVGVVKDGYHADKTDTYAVGHISQNAVRLIEVTNKAMQLAISECRSGNRLSNVSHIIQTTAESAGYSVVRSFVGHGIGIKHHEEPEIPNFGTPNRGPRIEVGMVLKPHIFINAGKYDVEVKDDGWSVVTKDGSLSACNAETIAILDSGPEVLTGPIHGFNNYIKSLKTNPNDDEVHYED